MSGSPVRRAGLLGGSQPPADRVHQRLRLDQGLDPLALGRRVDDDATAGAEPDASGRELEGPDRDVELQSRAGLT